MNISVQEQLFGKQTRKEITLDYIPETILVLVIIMIIFLSCLFYFNNKSKIFEQPISIPTKHMSTVNSSAFTNECDLSFIYLQSNIESLNTKQSVILNNNYNAINLVNKSTDKITPSKTIYQALIEEFKNDLSRWSATINHSDLTIDFQNTTFNAGGSMLDQQYKAILTEFCPRYITILNKYADNIEAVSIEGHSSSEWHNSISPDEAYLKNMLLSQQRTNAVLAYCLRLPTMEPYKEWLYNILITGGLSSSNTIIENEIENILRSRRVEFKVYLQN